MRRREYLATAATSLGGCSAMNTPEPPASTATSTTAPTRTVTATPSPTPEHWKIAAEHIATAEASIRAALDTYIDYASPAGETLTDVDASTQYRPFVTRSHIGDAQSELAQATEHAQGDPADRITRLQGTTVFIDGCAQAQVVAGNCYLGTGGLVAAIQGENFGRPVDDWHADLKPTLDRFEDQVDSTVEETEPSDTAPIDAISETEYRNKVDQFRREISTFRALLDDQFRDTILTAFELFGEGANLYLDEQYTTAFQRFNGAHGQMATARDYLVELNPAAAAMGYVETLRCMFEVLTQACDHMAKSSDYDNQKKRTAELRTAQDALKSCNDAIKYMPTAEQILEMD